MIYANKPSDAIEPAQKAVDLEPRSAYFFAAMCSRMSAAMPAAAGVM